MLHLGVNHRVYLHIVWTTRDRRPLINREAALFLNRFLRAVARQERTQILELGMVTTHLHLLARLHPVAQIPRLLQRWKGGSSAVAARELGFPRDRLLRWAPGYTVHSVSLQAIDKVANYVRNQAIRHPKERIAGWDPAAIIREKAEGQDDWEVVVA